MTRATEKVLTALDNLAGPLARLRRSLTKPDSCFPLGVDGIADETVDEIDQFLQRFQQVVDITLRKLFPSVTVVVSGTAPPRFFRDMLDLLERAEIIADASWWAEVNDQRNRLAHEYAMEASVRASELNTARAAAQIVVEQLERIRGLAEKL